MATNTNDDDGSSPSLLSATITTAATDTETSTLSRSVEAAVSISTFGPSSSSSATLLDLPLEIIDRITSYFLPLNNIIITPSHSESIDIISALSRSCKILRSSMELNLQPYVRRITKQRWHRLPRPFVNPHFVKLVSAYELRMKIFDGITEKMAKKLMVPHSTLLGRPYTKHRVPGKRSIPVYTVHTIFACLSSLYPTVEAYETALVTKRRAARIAQLTIEENRRRRVERERLRNERKAEIRAILKECHADFDISFTNPYRDLNLVNLSEQYALTGSKKTLRKFTEDARVVGVQIARSVEVNKLMKVNGVDAKTINAAERAAYAKTGDSDILDRIKTLIQEEVRKNARRAEVIKLMKVNGVDVTKTVAQSDMEDYATTGKDDILERTKMAIQEEKDRLERRRTAAMMDCRKNARRAEVKKLMKVNGVDVKKTVAQSDIEDYATTGEDEILERIKMTIQEEKDRLERRRTAAMMRSSKQY